LINGQVQVDKDGGIPDLYLKYLFQSAWFPSNGCSRVNSVMYRFSLQ